MSHDDLIRPANEDGYIIAWKYKYQYETGRLDGQMTYGEALKQCTKLCADDPEKTFWPHRISEDDAASYGKFHKAH